jgi:hypothetical protein
MEMGMEMGMKMMEIRRGVEASRGWSVVRRRSRRWTGMVSPKCGV